jgi:glycosyltransferase involved in cell wall biosynthesis
MDCILAYTEQEALELRQVLPPAVAVIGAQNAIDQGPIRVARTEWTKKNLQEFSTSNDLEGRRIVLFCGRLRNNPSTGVALLIEAMSILRKQNDSYLAVIIGDGEDRGPLMQLAEQHNLTAHVRWLGAQYEESSLAPWFLSSLCFAYPGPIGLSILHAMGYGLPVITHGDRRRHNPEIAALVNEWNGLEFLDGSATKLAEQIARIASDDAFRERLSVNARETSEQRFSLELMTERFLSAINAARDRSLRGART